MAVLVGQDVGLRERATLRAELRAQVVEEAQVDVHLLVGRTIEGTDVLGGRTASRRCLSAEEGRLRNLVLPSMRRELTAPVLLHAVDEGNDSTVVAPIRVGARSTFLR